MIHLLIIICLGLISKVEAQGTNMGVEFQVQFPYMPEGQPILMMYSTMMNKFDVYVTAPFSDHPVFERVRITRLQVSYYVVQRQHLISRSDTTTSIVAKGKQRFGMTVFMPVSVHSAASFLAIPTSGWGLEYYVLVPKTGPSIVLISSVEENEISVRFTERMEQLESQFTEPLLSTLIVNRKQAYIMQNCTGRTVGERPLGVTPVKITALYSFGVIVGTCEEYEFESKCQRKGVKIASGVTAEMLLPARTWGKHFIVPQTLKKSCNQNLRFLTLEENTIIRITAGDQTQVVNVAAGGALETYRLTSQSIVFVKASSRIMMYSDYHYPCNTEENINFQELVVVVPAEVFMNEYIWSTPLARGHTPSHYISVVAPIDNFFLEIDTIKVSLRWKKDMLNRWQTSFSRLSPGTHYISSVTGVPFGIYVVGLTPEYQFFHSAGFFISDFSGLCEKTTNRYNDGIDNDCDGFIDEERENVKDDDHDGDEDEDLSSYARTNLEGISLPLPPQVPPFVTGFLPQDCPCPEIQNCEMELCTDLTNYVVCLESIVTLTSCFIQTRMEAMRKLRLKEIKTSSQSHCLKQCPSFLHNCIPSDVTEGDSMSCSQLQSYLNCLKAVTNNPSCSRSFKDEARRWITSTDNMIGKALCLEGMTTASPEDWQEVAGMCLKLNKAGKQHHEAVRACSNMNSELATIMDANENLGASAALTTGAVDSAYIALTYINGQWSWPSGLQNAYRNWREGHVNKNNNTADDGKNCATIDKSVEFKWVAVSCNTSHSYMCKRQSCDARPLTKNSNYDLISGNPGLPMLRDLKSEEKDQSILAKKGKCPYFPSTCLHVGVIDPCLTFHDQIDCFQEFFRNRKCTNAYKADSLSKFTNLLNMCIPPPPGGTTLPTESTLPAGHTDFPMDVNVTTRQYEDATESISTRDPGFSAIITTEVRTPSMAPGANCEDMYRVCLPEGSDRLSWCQKVDNHWNCMKGLINTLTCTEDIRNMASQWMIENGRPLHCPPTTPTAIPQVILQIEEKICGMAPTCVDQPHYESVCQEDSDGRVQLQCLNEVIDKDYCFPREAKSAKLGRMAIVDKMLEYNCEGLNYEAVELLKFEPDCEQCITLGMTTIFFYYHLKETLMSNDQCNTLYFDYCNGDDVDCQNIDGWASGCAFPADCETDFVWTYELKTHPIEAICNTWRDPDDNQRLVVAVPTVTFKSVNFRFRARLSSDFSAFNRSAMVGVSRVFIVKKLVDENKAMVQLPSTNDAEGRHGCSIFWYIVVAALNVAALVTRV
ncbi:uncharacterized protein LOC131929181 isoform X2 [Physella acuta]|uniref:uncharacterized protein LOC131929181 isoform X2 n=1 Tax=Physella acuta TaxID=109671 RepID=UPI0027DE856A|nr:uncharacterized protein LOC131929181 isoform X2 [Physella acuta]